MKIRVDVNKRHAISVGLFVLLIALGIFVVAYGGNDAQKMGHTANEVHVNIDGWSNPANLGNFINNKVCFTNAQGSWRNCPPIYAYGDELYTEVEEDFSWVRTGLLGPYDWMDVYTEEVDIESPSVIAKVTGLSVWDHGGNSFNGQKKIELRLADGTVLCSEIVQINAWAPDPHDMSCDVFLTSYDDSSVDMIIAIAIKRNNPQGWVTVRFSSLGYEARELKVTI